MKIDVYERIWMWAAAAIIAVFITAIGLSSVAYGLHPPSHVETIDPAKVFTDPRFSQLGKVVELPDGTIEVQIVAVMFAFAPSEVRVPAGRPIRFRMTSTDVTPFASSALWNCAASSGGVDRSSAPQIFSVGVFA